MYSSIIRTNEYICALSDFIKLEYGIYAHSITPAKRGFYGETWRLKTENHNYFVKLNYSNAHKQIYERSFPVMEHLRNNGIDFISQVIKTKSGKLSSTFDGAVLGVFNWINGDNIETDETKAPEYQMLAKIYTVPFNGLSIRSEDFSGNSSNRFFNQWNSLDNNTIRSVFEKNCIKLDHRAARLKYFADLCRGDTNGFVLTHGDAGGNMILDGDKYYIVDWDDPIFSPPERDAWNMLCYEGKEWAGCVFHKALRDNGINYILRSERLAYYCYYYFFYYLTEYLDNFMQLGIVNEKMEKYFCGFYNWAENRATYADKTFK